MFCIQCNTLNDSRLKITNRAITGLSYCDIFKVCFSDIRYANQLQMENILKITVYGWKTSKVFRSYEPKQSRIKKELKLTLEASETKYELNFLSFCYKFICSLNVNWMFRSDLPHCSVSQRPLGNCNAESPCIPLHHSGPLFKLETKSVIFKPKKGILRGSLETF